MKSHSNLCALVLRLRLAIVAAMASVLGGKHSDGACCGELSGAPDLHGRAGSARALAVTGMKRNAALLDVPTVHEAGVSGYAFDIWYGVLFPTGTPRKIVMKTSNEIARMAKQPIIRERFSAGGIDALINSPEEFAVLIRRDAAKRKKVVAAANIKIG